MPRRADRLSLQSKRKNLKRRQLFLERLEERSLLASVMTDKLDYAPAETALITASGFQSGESVQFQVLHNDGTPNTVNGHFPWTVTDGSAADLDGAVNGNIRSCWYVDPDDSAFSSFSITANGLLSGLSASTTFTDAPAADLVQLIPNSLAQGTAADLSQRPARTAPQFAQLFQGPPNPHLVGVHGFSGHQPICQGVSRQIAERPRKNTIDLFHHRVELKTEIAQAPAGDQALTLATR